MTVCVSSANAEGLSISSSLMAITSPPNPLPTLSMMHAHLTNNHHPASMSHSQMHAPYATTITTTPTPPPPPPPPQPLALPPLPLSLLQHGTMDSQPAPPKDKFSSLMDNHHPVALQNHQSHANHHNHHHHLHHNHNHHLRQHAESPGSEQQCPNPEMLLAIIARNKALEGKWFGSVRSLGM